MEKDCLENKLFTFWDNNRIYYQIAESIEYEPYLIRAREQLIKEIFLGSRVLDVACGSAEMQDRICARATYFGIDVSSVALNLASGRKHKLSHFIRGNVSKIPIKDSSMDFVICVNSIEHFVSPDAVLAEMWRICENGGKIILILPNWGDYILRILPAAEKKYKSMSFRFLYILRQLIYQSVRILNKKAYFFPVIDCSFILKEAFTPDNDAVYVASTREIENYFRCLGARHIHVEFRNDNDAMRPYLKYILKNLFRIYKRLNPYYKYHGANLIIITK